MRNARPEYVVEFHAIQRKWAERIKREPQFDRRQALYRQAYDEMFVFTRNHISAAKCEFGFNPVFLWGPHAAMRNRDVLEMGAGLGSAALLAASWARRVCAIEASAEARQIIRDRAAAAGITNLEVREDDILLGRIPNESIDVIYSNDFIEHLTEEDGMIFFRSAWRVLCPGGTIFTLTPSKLSGPHDSTQWIGDGAGPAEGFHLREYSYADLCGVLRAAGFDKVRARAPFAPRFPFRPPYVPAWIVLAIERRVKNWESNFVWKCGVDMVNVRARKPYRAA